MRRKLAKVVTESDWTLRGGLLWLDDPARSIKVSEIVMPTHKKKHTKAEYLAVLSDGYYHGKLSAKLKAQLDEICAKVIWYNPVTFESN